jgi:hypothetical protein
MKIYNTIGLMQEYARIAGKFCMYISWVGQNDSVEIVKAAPYMDADELCVSSRALLVFDTEKEMYSHYDMTVGDNGPTNYNSYNGTARVYAVTCNNKGELGTENT